MNKELYNKILEQQKEIEGRLKKLYNEENLQERAIRYNEGVIVGLGIALELISEEQIKH